MRGLWYLLAIIAVLFVGSALCEVDVLTDENFDAYIAENEFVLVEFYAPWCGHCKALEPNYLAASKELEAHGVKLAKVDATEEKNLAGKFEIKGFPTMKWFRGGNIIDYSGGREADEIVSWCIRKTLPPYTIISTQEELDAFRANPTHVLGYFPKFSDGEEKVRPEGSESLVQMMSVGVMDAVPLGMVVNADLVPKEASGHNVEIVEEQLGKNQLNIPGDSATHEDLDSWMRTLVTSTSPVFAHLPTVFERIQRVGVYGAIFFVDKEAHAETYDNFKAWSVDFAKEFKEHIIFTYVGKEFFDRIGMVGGDSKDIPTVVVTDFKRNWLFDKSAGMDKETLQKHFAGIVSGDIKPLFKSEPIPESNDGPVVTVVGDTFEKIVLDPSKDVLMEFYAPWCGHCKSLAPIYEELAEEYASSEDVIIAKMDATANDHTADIDIKGFPSLYFFPKNNGAPIEFTGADRSLESLSQFVEENTSEDEHDEL